MGQCTVTQSRVDRSFIADSKRLSLEHTVDHTTGTTTYKGATSGGLEASIKCSSAGCDLLPSVSISKESQKSGVVMAASSFVQSIASNKNSLDAGNYSDFAYHVAQDTAWGGAVGLVMQSIPYSSLIMTGKSALPTLFTNCIDQEQSSGVHCASAVGTTALSLGKGLAIGAGASVALAGVATGPVGWALMGLGTGIAHTATDAALSS